MSTNGRREGNYTGCRQHTLYYQGWTPDTTPSAILLVVHGLAEHGGRYHNLVNYFVPGGFAVFTPDLRGHGRSEGLRGYVERFSDYTEDIDVFVEFLKGEYPGVPLFMVGHSMGGTIAADYCVARAQKLDGLILSAPVLKTGSSITRLEIAMARVLSALLPKAGVSSIDFTAVSRDPQVVRAYVDDPLVFTGKIRARLGAEVIDPIEKKLPSLLRQLTLPLLVMHGTADRLSNREGSALLFDAAASSDKTIKYYPDYYHEIFNDPERKQVFKDMADWLAARLVVSGKEGKQ